MADMIKATRLRVGRLVLIKNELYRTHYVQHITPGKGQACIQTRMRHLKNGNLIDMRFSSDDKIERAILDTVKMEYLYEEDGGMVFMNTENYEQVTLADELLGDDKLYILSNQTITVDFYNEEPVGVELPLSIVLQIKDTEPGLKNVTAATSNKPAIMETGLKVMIPMFVNSGDFIKINTETGDYISRADGYDDK